MMADEFEENERPPTPPSEPLPPPPPPSPPPAAGDDSSDDDDEVGPLSPSMDRRKHLVKKRSMSHDLETGQKGVERTIDLLIRSESECLPMSPKQRRKHDMRKLFQEKQQEVIDRVKKRPSTSGPEALGTSKRSMFNLFSSQANASTADELPVQLHGRMAVQPSVRRRPSLLDYSIHVYSEDDDDEQEEEEEEVDAELGQHDISERTPRVAKKTSTHISLRPKAQYRLEIVKTPRGNIATRCLRAIGISAGADGIYENVGSKTGCSFLGIRPNDLVTGYLHWAFQATFFTYFLSAIVSFYILTIFFAALLLWSGRNHPNCINVNGIQFGISGSDFHDAYALSWTTFSTVGYGLISPSTSVTVSAQKRCAGIECLTTFEAYIGILFASMTGAIVYAKIMRIRSIAQVIFSDPIVVRYGQGVLQEDDDENSSRRSGDGASAGGRDDDNKGNTVRMKNIPCPILEFRVVNRLHSALQGEIIDGQLNIVASLDEKYSDPTLQKLAHQGLGRMRKGRKHGRPNVKRRKQKSTGATLLTLSEHSFPDMTNLGNRSQSAPFTPTRRRGGSDGSSDDESELHSMTASRHRRANYAFDEDPGNLLIPRLIFSKLEIDSPEHPFFKRVWIARHHLDVHSPLLTAEARQLVRLNGGYWPERLNSHEGVRKCIQFEQILVSFSGTSNVDANSVYAQKAYDFCDMNVGYRFVTMLYRDPADGSVKCDPTLINDVQEQVGGGGEPLQTEEERDFSEILRGETRFF